MAQPINDTLETTGDFPAVNLPDLALGTASEKTVLTAGDLMTLFNSEDSNQPYYITLTTLLTFLASITSGILGFSNVTVSTTAPLNPNLGDIWIDIS